MHRRTAIKFCGLTRSQDIEAAIAVGPDYIGLVLAEGSSRQISVVQACVLAEQARESNPAIGIVALVRNCEPGDIARIIADIQPDLIQFHGSETEADCLAYACPYWKGVGMADNDDVPLGTMYPSADALVLDGHPPAAPGGSGEAFDWSRWPKENGRSLVLAGGLHAGNVERAIAMMRPFAVDVSSGIESVPGVKDAQRMAAFADAVRRADEAIRVER